MECFIKRESDKYVLIIKYDKHKCYIYQNKNNNLYANFVVRCYIPHQDSNIYACLNKDQPFANLEVDIFIPKPRGKLLYLVT